MPLKTVGVRGWMTWLLVATASCSESVAPDAHGRSSATAGSSSSDARQDAGNGNILGAGTGHIDGAGAGDGSLEGPGGSVSAVGGSGAEGADAGSGRVDAGSGGVAGAAPEGTPTGETKRGTCPTREEDIFSFFLTSREALVALSGSEDGFGGALGGLEGADAICQTIAESVSKCQKHRVWRAFLSTSTEDAIDRIGPGPWYDRLGRLLANNRLELLYERPLNAHSLIKEDLPNEFGVPNHNPTATPGGEVDNHEVLTGSGTDGRKYYQDDSEWGFGTACGPDEVWSIEAATCWDWTSNRPEGCPRVGHSWPRVLSGANWISVWNEGGCAPGGVLTDTATATGGPDGTRRVGSAGGYGGFYCFGLLGAG